MDDGALGVSEHAQHQIVVLAAFVAEAKTADGLQRLPAIDPEMAHEVLAEQEIEVY